MILTSDFTICLGFCTIFAPFLLHHLTISFWVSDPHGVRCPKFLASPVSALSQVLACGLKSTVVVSPQLPGSSTLAMELVFKFLSSFFPSFFPIFGVFCGAKMIATNQFSVVEHAHGGTLWHHRKAPAMLKTPLNKFFV